MSDIYKVPSIEQDSSCTVYVLSLTDFVRVRLSLRFRRVTVVVSDFTFYDCSVVQQLSGSMP